MISQIYFYLRGLMSSEPVVHIFKKNNAYHFCLCKQLKDIQYLNRFNNIAFKRINSDVTLEEICIAKDLESVGSPVGLILSFLFLFDI